MEAITTGLTSIKPGSVALIAIDAVEPVPRPIVEVLRLRSKLRFGEPTYKTSLPVDAKTVLIFLARGRIVPDLPRVLIEEFDYWQDLIRAPLARR